MQYPDGTEICPGDIVAIDEKYRGKVVASMDTGRYLHGHEHWAYLGNGIMVDTDFGGLVHYTSAVTDELVFVSRENPQSEGRT